MATLAELAFEQDRRPRFAAELAVDLLSYLSSPVDRLFKILNSENASALDPDAVKHVRTRQETQRDLHFA